MKKFLVILLLGTFFLFSAKCTLEKKEVKIMSFDYNKSLGIGVNMGNALEAPYEGAWGMYIKDEYFKIIKDRGFNHVRIPIKWSAHAEKEPPYAIDEFFLERVEHVVKKALENDLYVIINIHHFDELYSEPEKYKDMLVVLWGQIAEKFKNYSHKLAFEIYNEPAQQLTPQIWNEMYPKALIEIRKTNKDRIVIIDVPNWGHWSAIKQLKIVNDPNIIVSFHYYEPFGFTHQGAEWVSPQLPTGVIWNGTSEETAEIDRHFKEVYEWAKENNVPIYLGEFGAYSKADYDSRVRWTKAVSQTAQKYGFSIAYWEFGAGFGIYDRSTDSWREELTNAVFGK